MIKEAIWKVVSRDLSVKELKKIRNIISLINTVLQTRKEILLVFQYQSQL